MATTQTLRSALRGLLGLLLCASISNAAAQSVIRISGTGSATGTMKLLGEAFGRSVPDVKVEVLTAVGSTGGILAVIDGAMEIAVTNRLPKPEELARAPLVATEYGKSPFVLAVHKDLGVTELSFDQVAALYREVGAKFPNGRRARPVLRTADVTDTRLLRSFSPAVAEALDLAAQRKGIYDAPTDTTAADLIENTSGAFGGSTLSLMLSERRPLVALTLEGKQPTLANVANGGYPFVKQMFMIVHSGRPSASVKRFVEFVQSEAGRRILAELGHVMP